MTVAMVELQVLVSGSVSLARFDEIGLQLADRGLALSSRHAGLGLIVGTTADRSLAARLDIADVISVRESPARPGAATTA